MYGEDNKNNIFFLPPTEPNIEYESHFFVGIWSKDNGVQPPHTVLTSYIQMTQPRN